MTKLPTHYKLMFPSEYLRAVDLLNKEHIVTIEEIVKRDLVGTNGEHSDKWCVRYVGTKRWHVLNITAGIVLSGLYGEDPNNWIGKSIIIYPTKDRSYGKIVDCIRIKEEIPKGGGDDKDRLYKEDR